MKGLIKDKYQQSFDFKFEFVYTNQVLKYINEINCNKSSGGYIPTKIIKMAKGEFTVPITNCLSKRIPLSTFWDELKTAGIISVYKNKRRMINQ